MPRRIAALSIFGLALLFAALPALADTSAQMAIRKALDTWKAEFNARDSQAVCGLFAHDLRYDVRGLPEQNYADMCGRLQRVLASNDIGYTYTFDIKEIIVSGDLAVVRLDWISSVSRPGASVVTTPEHGIDVFRRQPDGTWKIIRYLAYDAGT